MTVETATYLNALDSAKPANTELVAEGDDHLRLLKSVLKATFPGRGLAEKQPVSKTITFAPGLDEVSVLFLANGATQANLPAISGLANGTHYWFWAEDNDLTLTTLDTALVNGAAALLLEQGTGACVIYTGTGWIAVGLGGGSGAAPVNLIEGENIVITGTYPDLTIDSISFNPIEGSNITISGTYPDITFAAIGEIPTHSLVIRQHASTVSVPTGGNGRVPFATAVVDILGDYDEAEDKFVVPFTGIYAVSASCNFGAIPDVTTTVTLAIGHGILNTVHITTTSGPTVLFSSTSRTLQVSCLLSLTQGDLVDVQIGALASGVSCSTGRFQVEYVHPAP